MRTDRATIRAFTLIEVLVSMAVSVLLTGVLVSTARVASRSWERSADRLAVASQADAMLDLIERDLRSRVVAPAGSIGWATTVLEDEALSGWWVSGPRTKPAGVESWSIDAAEIEHCRFGVGGVWLRFFAAGTESGRSVIRAIGYQIIRRELASGSGEYSYLLHRAEVSAENTFTAGMDLHPASGGYTVRSATPGHAGNLIRPSLSQAIGDHVVDFGLRTYLRDGGSDEPAFPRSDVAEYLADEPDDGYPAEVEIMVRVLEPQGVRLLARFETTAAGEGGETTWWSIVERHSRTFSRRIALP